MGKTTLLQTQLLLPWLLNTLKPYKHSFAPQQQREQLVSTLKTLHEVALNGYQHAHITPSVKVMVPGTSFAMLAPFRESVEVPEQRHLLKIFPEMCDLWEQAGAVAEQGGITLAQIQEASLMDWTFFVHFVPKSKLPGPLLAIFRELCNSVAEQVAQGVELWLLLVYLPSCTGEERVRPLHTEHGTSVRMDDMSKLQALRALKKAKGSSSTYLHGKTGDKHLDDALTHASCNLYLDKLTPVFSSICRLALTWDPGSYSGLSVCLGMGYSPDNGKAATLPVKVCPREAKSGFQQSFLGQKTTYQGQKKTYQGQKKTYQNLPELTWHVFFLL